jgi:hypothetical protein
MKYIQYPVFDELKVIEWELIKGKYSLRSMDVEAAKVIVNNLIQPESIEIVQDYDSYFLKSHSEGISFYAAKTCINEVLAYLSDRPAFLSVNNKL